MPRGKKKNGRPGSGKDKKGQKKDKGKRDKRAKAPEEQITCPGNISKDMWMGMANTEASEVVVAHAVQFIMDKALSLVYDKIVQEMAFPCAARQASATLMNLMQMAFVPQDPGEIAPENNPQWLPDEEPEAPPIDTWARGALPIVEPVREATPPLDTTHASLTKSRLRRRIATPQREAFSQEDLPPPPRPSTSEKNDQTKRRHTTARQSMVRSRDDLNTPEKRRSPPPRGASGRTAAEIVSDIKAQRMTKIRLLQEEEERERKRQEKILADLKGRSFTFDDGGKVIVVKKPDPERLPDFSVRMGYQVDAHEPQGKKKRTTKKGRKGGGRTSHDQRPRSGQADRSLQTTSTRDNNLQEAPRVQPTADQMKMAVGVTLRCGEKGGFTKSGAQRRTDPKHLSRKEYADMMSSEYVEVMNIQTLLGAQPR